MSLLSEVGRRLEAALWESWRQLGRPTGGIGVACSGGADSQGLLYACHQLALVNPLFPRPVVLHFDHHIQDDSHEVAQFVRDEALRLDLGIHEGSANGDLAARTQGIEEAAREARYGWLTEIAQELSLSAVFTAHHGDDQVETVGLGLLRGGKGSAAVHGMPSRRPLNVGSTVMLARPFLEISRNDLHKWVHDGSIAFREDPSNRDTQFARNAMRHEILPSLSRQHRDIEIRLLQLSHSARAMEENYDRLFEAAVTHSEQTSSSGLGTEQVTWRHSKLKELPEGLAHLLLTNAVGDPKEQSEVVTQKAMAFALEENSGSHELSRTLHLIKSAESDTITLRRRVPLVSPDAVPLSIPGHVTSADGTMTFMATMQSDVTPTFSNNRQWVPLAGITGSLQIRCANPDETMIPFGDNEERPLLDILQDAGVPSHERRVRQGIADAAGMLWYPGVRAAERCRVGKEDALIVLDYQGVS